MKAFHNLRYRIKLALSFILVIALILTAITIIVGTFLSRHLENNIRRQADITSEYLNYAMTEFFDYVRELSIKPLFDPSVLEIMSSHSSPGESVLTFDESYKLTNYLGSLSYDMRIISHVSLFLMDGHYVSTDGNVYKWNESELTWMQRCSENPRLTVIMPDNNTITVFRALEMPLKGNMLGYIHITLRTDAIPAIIRSITLPDDTQVFVFNEHNECIFPINHTSTYEQLMSQSGKHYVYSMLTSEDTRLSTVVFMSTEPLKAETTQLFYKIIAILFVSLVLTGIISVFLSRILTKPIQSLKDKMELVSEGRFETRMVVQSNDELGQLETMFNSMTESIETLIHEYYEVSIVSRGAQISALQSQISPHFLYNTLETINMMAVSEGCYDISEAVSDLGRMMRYCVSNEIHFATLENELDFLRAYYGIQSLRLDNLGDLVIDCPDELLSCRVPKLLLQPFVENTIQHGLGDEKVDIIVKIRSDGNDLSIVMENNGIPMTADEISSLNRKLLEVESSQYKSDGKGYGLPNVHKRLRLIYGNKYGLNFDENYKNGVRFIIRLGLGAERNVSGNDS